MKYILAIDQGTTSSRTILFDHTGHPAFAAQREFRQIYPKPGWVEHDPDEIWATQLATIREVIGAANCQPGDITAIGITNQRETTVLWDRASGKPFYKAIVWQDRRTAELCSKLRASRGELIRRKTGLEIDAYFSASKISWMLDNIDGLREKAAEGNAAFGTIDSWLIWNLTGGRHHVTDASNASRTLLFDIHTLDWDDELLEIFDIPRSVLPKIVRSSGAINDTADIPELKGVPILGIAGDQQAALFGQACFGSSMAKNTYGTGCFMLQNTGRDAAEPSEGLLSTVAWTIDGSVNYALEGSVFIGGAVVQWLRDELQIIDSSEDVEELAASVDDSGGVIFVPAFAGIGTPHWDQSARGTILGLTRGTGKAHIARAAVESIAFQTADLAAAMHAASGRRLAELRVDGGATRNDALLQFQADILGIPVVRSAVTETTALGAAYLAGLAAGFWSDLSEIEAHWQEQARFYPSITASAADDRIARWHEGVRRSLGWEK